mgnify:CR=1 FL=1
MLQFLPYALAAYGGYQGYKSAKDQGASGIGRLLGGATGAYAGYNLGQVGGFAQNAGFKPASSLFASAKPVADMSMSQYGMSAAEIAKQEAANAAVNKSKSSLADILFRREVDGQMQNDPLKIAALAGAVPFALGAFDNKPTDIYQPTYNLAYADFAEQRPNYSYIDPQTGQEKAYEKVYIPEADPKNQGTMRMGPYAMERTKLRTGGLAEIKKFNEGGINYLPSKVSHDEDDATNYVRAHGYVEDGAGVGDKDEDTMLAQLADGEFVTRADGVLGAGIIAGGNPNSMKDMREKGAKYFYEQQARYKRVFDLLKEKNGGSKQKTN